MGSGLRENNIQVFLKHTQRERKRKGAHKRKTGYDYWGHYNNRPKRAGLKDDKSSSQTDIPVTKSNIKMFSNVSITTMYGEMTRNIYNYGDFI